MRLTLLGGVPQPSADRFGFWKILQRSVVHESGDSSLTRLLAMRHMVCSDHEFLE